MMKRSWPWWVLAFVVTVASAAHQRRTGPTYALRGRLDVAGQSVAYRLPRSADTGADARVVLPISASDATATLEYRRYRSHDEWQTQPFVRTHEAERDRSVLQAFIPQQPAAGKVMYRVVLHEPGRPPRALVDEPAIIRFKGPVPTPVLLTHIITIFTGMLLSMRTGFEALRRGPRTRGLALTTLGCLVVGGLIMGPIVQKYAFDAYWTGWPWGHDLTDNKLAVAVLFWIIAIWRTARRPAARGWPLAAAAVTLVVWLIPHSLLGSELDYTKLETTRPAATTVPATLPAEEAR